MRLLLVGFGNVGRRLAEILTSNREVSVRLRRVGLSVIGVTTGNRGSLVDPNGIDLDDAVRQLNQTNLFDPSGPSFSRMPSLEAAEKLDYDVLVELSPLNIERRGEPAVSYCRAALARGRHVVTANKGPVAFSYRELQNLARESGSLLLHESTVMDGAPVFSLARSGLIGCRITGVEGILNSTTNFVLSRMEEGVSLEASVRRAQDEGFAEADAAYDLDGWDAAAKICVLANALMGAELNPFQVERQSISSVSSEKVNEARARNSRMKVICRAGRVSGEIRARVSLEEIAASHPFANVAGTGNILRIQTDLMGPIMISQESPSLDDTAYGVLNDLLSIDGYYN